MAKANAGFAMGLLAIMLAITLIVVMPAVLSDDRTPTHTWTGQALLVKLLLAVAVPVGLGLAIRARSRHSAERLERLGAPRGDGAAGVFFVQGVIDVNYEALLAMQAGALLGGLLSSSALSASATCSVDRRPRTAARSRS